MLSLSARCCAAAQCARFKLSLYIGDNPSSLQSCTANILFIFITFTMAGYEHRGRGGWENAERQVSPEHVYMLQRCLCVCVCVCVCVSIQQSPHWSSIQKDKYFPYMGSLNVSLHQPLWLVSATVPITEVKYLNTCGLSRAIEIWNTVTVNKHWWYLRGKIYIYTHIWNAMKCNKMEQHNADYKKGCHHGSLFKHYSVLQL